MNDKQDSQKLHDVAERPLAARFRRVVVGRRSCRRRGFGVRPRTAGRRDQRDDQDARRHLRRCVHPSGERFASRRADLAGRVRLAPGDARHRQAHRRRRLLGARAESVLSRRPRRRCSDSASVQFPEPGRHGEAAAADGRRSTRRARPRRTPSPSSRSSTRSRRSTRRRRSARRATAWADRWWSGPPPRCPTASAPARRSTAADWSPTSPTARTCSRRRSRRACTSASRRTTTQRQPDAKDKLKEAFAAAKVPAEIEVYPAPARLVRARHAGPGRRADLQQARRRARVGQTGRAVQGGACLAPGPACGWHGGVRRVVDGLSGTWACFDPCKWIGDNFPVSTRVP